MSLVKFNDFNINAIKVTQLKKGKFMRNFYLDYEGGVFELQTPKFLLDWGGVPRKDEYHRTDSDRRYVMYGLDPVTDLNKTGETSEQNSKRDDELDVFKSKLLELEELMQSDDVQQRLFGHTKADFVPLYRGGDSKLSTPTIKHMPDKVKFKFYCDRDTGDPEFELFKRSPDGTREELSTEGMSIDHLHSEIFQFMGTQRLVISFRGWAERKPKPNMPLRYGVSMIIKRVEYTKRIPKPKPKLSISEEFLD